MTPREEKFARLLVEGKSQSEAYRAVYPNSKRWKADSVHQNASKLAAKVKPRTEALKLKAAEEAGLTREWVLDRLMKNARIAMGEEKVNLTTKDGTEVVAIDRDVSGANKALELLGKEVGMFVDRSENTNTNYNISDQPLSEDDWASQYADEPESVH